jgi:tRNA(fMet)-specific endonuclease VapC
MQKQQAFAARFVSLPFDDAAALVYARIRGALEQAGTPVGSNDLMIASIAMANGLILITHNTREFGRVVGLQIEDWEAEDE